MRYCSVEDCNGQMKTKGLCNMHYARLKRHGSTDRIAPALHGFSKTRLYTVWIGMRQRTTQENHHAYAQYGGRGIKVCSRWLNSFQDFYDDVGDRQNSDYSLDRINNDGGYTCGKCDECIANNSPMNVRWATHHQQQVNRRHRKSRTGYKGVTIDKNGRYFAAITFYRQYVRLGGYKTAEDAARAYNEAAKQLFGNDAILNIV